jgi:homoserine O-acetyltransferase
MQKSLPTRDDADKFLEQTMTRITASLDDNDLLYQMHASRNCDPSPQLEKISVPVTLVYSADDFINSSRTGDCRARIQES